MRHLGREELKAILFFLWFLNLKLSKLWRQDPEQWWVKAMVEGWLKKGSWSS